MFEVLWTDPDRELVGEHRAKKELAREQKARERERSSRSSLSTQASSSSNDKPFGLFGSKSLKKARSKKSTHPQSRLATTTLDSKATQGSFPLLNQALNLTELHPEPLSLSVSGISLAGTDSLLDHGEPSSPSERDSVFSKRTEKSDVTHYSTASCTADSPTSPLIQTLGPSSFVTRSTEVAVSPRTAEGSGLLHREVSIRSDGIKGHTPTPPIPSTGTAQDLPIRLPAPRNMDSPVNLTPNSRRPLRPISPSWASSFKPNNPDAWKPPDDWDCMSASESLTPGPGRHSAAWTTSDEGDETNLVALNLQAMELEVKKMAAASSAIVLQRLQEPWGSSHDPSQYQELEMERKRWVLSALDNMDPSESKDADTVSQPITTPRVAPKILVVHENKATTSYIAACHSSKQVYHLSTSPLPDRLYPNVRPLRVPSISANQFPAARQTFGAVYSLSMPSMIPSRDIPPLLKNIHRCLAPGAIFHLTIVDPMPVASTLGHLMRAWLEENLLLNLERHFRCTNPSKLFPIWLADNSLRAEGSTITTAKFLAVADLENHVENEQLQSESNLRKRLRSTVGRMLWTEVWGGYVTGMKWWWEDPACVQECVGLKTYWEYNLIEAVRGS